VNHGGSELTQRGHSISGSSPASCRSIAGKVGLIKISSVSSNLLTLLRRNKRGRPEGIQIEPCTAVVRDSWPTARLPRRSGRHRGERRISKRLEAEAIERLVAEYAGGTTAADLDQQYGLAKSSVLRLVRQAGERVRRPRLSVTEAARVGQLYEAGLRQKDIAERLGRSPSAVWHCLHRLGLV
jgi:DNA-binding NarL/FixJ family response regulator